MIPAGLLLFQVGTQLLPYSPVRRFVASSRSNLIVLKRWLLEVGREEEVREVVYRLHGDDRSSADREFT